MRTPQIQFRLGQDTLDQIDRIKAALGMTSRAEVIRVAVAKLSTSEAPAAPKTAKNNRRK